MEQWMLWGILIFSLAAFVFALLAFLFGRRRKDDGALSRELDRQRAEIQNHTQNSINVLGQTLLQNQRTSTEAQNGQLTVLQRAVTDSLNQINERVKTSGEQNDKRLNEIRDTMQRSMDRMQKSNEEKLDVMRQTVDEKLQKTLEERIAKSFESVNRNLEAVYKGLGDMKSLAGDVGSLKSVLSNVKTRGTLGEIQLGAILSEILTPEQYATNVITVPGSNNPVEFAVKMPGDGDGTIYLPIDSKFPMDTYQHLLDAYETSDNAQVEAAWKVLETRMKGCAKDIHEKYVAPPDTTDFAILFLPTEGLYAEVVRRGMVEKLQHDYKINIAGPTTMAALLNSLQMGFRTLAIQKRSGEVWKLLSAVKTEFGKFGNALATHQKHLDQASKDLDSLVGTRTRMIQSKLRQVESMPEPEAGQLLDKDGGENDLPADGEPEESLFRL